MTIATIAGHDVHVNEEGFLIEFDEWNETIAAELARDVGIDPLTDEHLKVLRFLRTDYRANGETPTLRRVSSVGGFDTKQLFVLFPKKPAKKMSYVAGVPKPVGCV
jgi:TusE/DsrC/DsvC family sulfur relay protein